MALYIRQTFPLGRFHATRWRENPFADPYGEWPPSPWRLLRTLANRWFSYSQETGDLDRNLIETLLRTIASELPTFYLPSFAVQGPALKQYLPTGEFAWSDPAAGSGAVKQSRTTLFPDSYFIVSPHEPVFWQWNSIELPDGQRKLLSALLDRVTYFGRAESHSRLGLVADVEQVNCQPVPHGGAPVLCPKVGEPLRLDALLAERTDAPPLADLSIPPGTEWIQYGRPPLKHPQPRATTQAPVPVHAIQFAIGADLFPPERLRIKVTERFRGRVLRYLHERAEPRALLSGKAIDGTPLTEHEHAYFVIWPDQDTQPSRLIVWRRGNPFDGDEVAAMMRAAERPIPWSQDKGWSVRLVPMPLKSPLPRDFSGQSTIWESTTPFVRPPGRHVLRKRGKKREDETVEGFCRRLVLKVWGVEPVSVERIDAGTVWMKLHESKEAREQRRALGNRTSRVAPGYRLRIRFAEPFTGPLIVGDSSHFGLGLFRAL